MIEASSPHSRHSSFERMSAIFEELDLQSSRSNLASPELSEGLCESPMGLSPDGAEYGVYPMSPPTPSAPPAYSPPSDTIGDEPTPYSNEKSAPPPYSSDDPEPDATALLRREQALRAAAQQRRRHLSQSAGPARPRPVHRPSSLRQMSLCWSPRFPLRSASRPPLYGSSGQQHSASSISFRLVSSDGTIGRVPELRTPTRGFVPRACTSDTDSDSGSDTLADSDSEACMSDDEGPDPQWCGRVAIWSQATQETMARCRRSSSMSGLQSLWPGAATGSETRFTDTF